MDGIEEIEDRYSMDDGEEDDSLTLEERVLSALASTGQADDHERAAEIQAKAVDELAGLDDDEIEELRRKTIEDALFSDNPVRNFVERYAVARKGSESRSDEQREAISRVLSAASPADAERVVRDLGAKYASHRASMYSVLQEIAVRHADASGIDDAVERVVGHASVLVAIRQALAVAGLRLPSAAVGVSDINSADGGHSYPDSVAAMAYVREASVACPGCGSLVHTEAIDFRDLFHERANALFLSLHGKLVQDCPSCGWAHVYDVDVVTHMPVRIVLSENPFSGADGDEVRIPAEAGLSGGEALSVMCGYSDKDSFSRMVSGLSASVGEAAMLIPSEDEAGVYRLTSSVHDISSDEGRTLVGIVVTRRIVSGYVLMRLYTAPTRPGGGG